MNVITFNIIFTSAAEEKQVLTQIPYLYVNSNVRTITNEIRNLVKTQLMEMINELNIPISSISLGLSTYSTISNNMHFFEIEIYKIKEIKEILLNL